MPFYLTDSCLCLLQNFWKIGVFFLIIQSYCFWCFQKGAELHTKKETYYQLEINFYQCLIRSSINILSLHGLMIAASRIKFGFKPVESYSRFSLWKGMLIAGYSELFELCRLIWSYSTDGPRMYFHEGLLILSFTLCYKGKSRHKLTFITVSLLISEDALSICNNSDLSLSCTYSGKRSFKN